MTREEIDGALAQIAAQGEADKVLQHFLLAALITKLFRERGTQLVVVGGTALEIYSDGQYASKDIDFALKSYAYPSYAAEIMESLGGVAVGIRPGQRPPLGHRCFCLERFRVTVDFCGFLAMSVSGVKSGMELVTYESPFGDVCVFPPEELIADRLVSATQPHRDEERLRVAKALVHLYRAGSIHPGFRPRWELLEKICGDPQYDVLAELRTLEAA